MNTDKSGAGRIVGLSTLGEPMSEEDFEKKMDRGELDYEYAEYLMDHRSVGNGEILIRLMERNELYDDFKDYMTRGKK
jgi:hypothetical protein